MNFNPISIYTSLIRNSKTKWITIIFTVIYIISPVDLVPDFLLPFGLIDDGLVLSFLIIALREISANKKYIDVEPK